MAKTNCTCCSLLIWDYTRPSTRHYIVPKRDDRKAGGVLIYNGRVLIVQSRGNKWGFPKGGFERGENALRCAEREVREETSFNVKFNEDDLKVKYKDTTFYVKHLRNEPPEIVTSHLMTPGNDCTGIGWIRLTCLKRLIQKERRSKCDVVRGLKVLTLNSINEEYAQCAAGPVPHEQPPQVMQFNIGARKFVEQYIEYSGRNKR
jgi:ADP-ribose pyrophosphatase YjhB (NUDIX family)